MIDHINETTSGHILTLEDPIEFVHKPKRCLVNQREVGAQTHSFNAALTSALREDPDVILVGELRDLETISARAHRGRDRAPRVRHACTRRARRRRSTASSTCSRRASRRRSARCWPSRWSGSRRRRCCRRSAAAASRRSRSSSATPAVRNLIRENKTYQIRSAMQVGARTGMVTMEAALADLVDSRHRSRPTTRASASPRAGDRAARVGARRCAMSVPDSDWDPLLRSLLEHMVKVEASDLYLSGGQPPGVPHQRRRLPGEEAVRCRDDRADGRLADDAGPARRLPRASSR